MTGSKPMRSCPACRRTVPLHEDRFVKHYLPNEDPRVIVEGKPPLCTLSRESWKPISVFGSENTKRWSFGRDRIYDRVDAHLCSAIAEYRDPYPRTFTTKEQAVAYAEARHFEVINK